MYFMRGVFISTILSINLIITFSCFSQNTNLSNGYFFDGEPYLAVNPANPQHIVVSWMGYAWASPLGIKSIVSFNGGQTWSSPVFQPHFSSTYKSADPSMVFDNAGNIYACYIDYRELPDSGGIYITRSTDGGFTWNYLSKAMDIHADAGKAPIDRPWLTIDPPAGRLYITSKPAPWITPPNHPYFMASADFAQTWSPWRYIDTTGFLVGSLINQPMAAPSVAPGGNFHCIYPSWVVTQNFLPGYIHASSSGNGNTFSYHGAYYSTTGVNDTLAKAGGRLVCDPSLPGHLAFTFLEAKYGDLDVFMIESYNDGASWTAPVRLNDDEAANGKMQDLVWGDFNSNGDLVVAWRDRRNSPGTGYTEASEIWGTLRWKDSTIFSANFRISDTLVAYQDVLSLNGNDFMSLAVAGDTLMAVWGDVRTGILSIWFSKVALHTLVPTGIHRIVEDAVPAVTVFPNPGNGLFYFRGDDVFEVSVTDYSGKTMRNLRAENPISVIDLSGVPPGNYLLNLKTRSGNINCNVLKK